MVMIAHPSLPAKSVTELVRLAKKKAGSLTYSSSGVGALPHLGMVLFESFAGISMVHVPYKGGAPATLDVIGGQIDLQFNNIVGSLPFAKAGKVRALAVSTAKPASALPEVPPVAKFYPKFDVASWMAIYAPANTPKDVLAILVRDAVWAISNPDSKHHIAELGADVAADGPAQLVAYTRNESELFARAVAAGGIPKE
jgi:tripartite-type tricarboxylate transporter receptor subunit TctC